MEEVVKTPHLPPIPSHPRGFQYRAIGRYEDPPFPPGFLRRDGGDDILHCIRPQFTRLQVSDLDVEELHVQNLVHSIAVRRDGWTDSIDLQPHFFRLTLDAATGFLFGRSIDSQVANGPHSFTTDDVDKSVWKNGFAGAFDRAEQILATRLHFKHKYWIFSPSDIEAACATCHIFVECVAQFTPEGNVSSVQDAPGERYIVLKALAAEIKDPAALRSLWLHLLLAGRDITGSLLSWLFFCLARDPRRFEKLRNSAVDVFGPYDAPRNFIFMALKDCRYLRQCLDETLELYPAVPMNMRQANKDTTPPRGGGKD